MVVAPSPNPQIKNEKDLNKNKLGLSFLGI